jgi:cysteine synthase
MGTWQGLVKSGSDPSVVAFEPMQSPFLTTDTGGSHQVEGVGVGFEPPFLDRAVLSEIRTVERDGVFNVLTVSEGGGGILWCLDRIKCCWRNRARKSDEAGPESCYVSLR